MCHTYTNNKRIVIFKSFDKWLFEVYMNEVIVGSSGLEFLSQKSAAIAAENYCKYYINALNSI